MRTYVGKTMAKLLTDPSRILKIIHTTGIFKKMITRSCLLLLFFIQRCFPVLAENPKWGKSSGGRALEEKQEVFIQ